MALEIRVQDRVVGCADVFPVVHALALRGHLSQLPVDAEGLLEAGLLRFTPDGFTLTDLGHRRHRALLEHERATLDLDLLGMAYARFPTLTRRMQALTPQWEKARQASRRRMVRDLCGIVDQAEPILRRSASVAPRFGTYIPRLSAAKRRLLAGDLRYAVDPAVESIGTVWRELDEDYLQTLGRGPEQKCVGR
jgi:hypothetical protein